jgi:hypothetical protein
MSACSFFFLVGYQRCCSSPPRLTRARVFPRGGPANDPLSPQPSSRARFGGYLRACVPRDGVGVLAPFPLGRASSIGRHPGERGEVALGERSRGHLEPPPYALVPRFGGAVGRLPLVTVSRYSIGWLPPCPPRPCRIGWGGLEPSRLVVSPGPCPVWRPYWYTECAS